MRTEYIQEFIVCARHLNMRQAASELHMAQSNLSIHMKQLESSLGSPLFVYVNKKLSLTEAGFHFLNESQRILDLYNNSLTGCLEISALESANDQMYIVAQQHSYVDLGAESYYRLINSLRRDHPTLEVMFSKASRRRFAEELKIGAIDLYVDYRCGKHHEIVADYTSKGFICKHLSTEPFVVWCEKDHPLNKHILSPVDLENIPIMAPCDVSFAAKSAIMELCHSYGFEASFVTAPTTSQPEFLNAHGPEAVYLYPLSFTQSHLLKAFDSMVSVSFTSPEVNIDCFALTYPTDNPFSGKLIDFLQQKA